MTTEAYEKRGELIRAPIRTRLGNIVMRWVRPDNPNIVVERRPAVPIPEPAAVPGEPVFPEQYEMFASSVAGCCGATYLRAAKTVEKSIEWTPERIEKEWSRTWKPTYDLYRRNAEAMTKNERLSEARYYRDSAELYSLERYTARSIYLQSPGNTRARIRKTPDTGAGVTISPDPFLGFTLKTPAGWYLRMDRDPVNTKTDEAIEPNDKPSFKGGTKNDVYASAHTPFADDKMSWCLTGMREGVLSGYSMMAACKGANIPVGAKVLAIFNQGQHNSNGKATPKSVAAAGFRLVLKTGNHNHPGHSTLYIYERVIQKGDYDEI